MWAWWRPLSKFHRGCWHHSYLRCLVAIMHQQLGVRYRLNGRCRSCILWVGVSVYKLPGCFRQVEKPLWFVVVNSICEFGSFQIWTNEKYIPDSNEEFQSVVSKFTLIFFKALGPWQFSLPILSPSFLKARTSSVDYMRLYRGYDVLFSWVKLAMVEKLPFHVKSAKRQRFLHELLKLSYLRSLLSCCQHGRNWSTTLVKPAEDVVEAV